MTAPASSPDLSQFDRPPDTHLDPEIFARNTRALAETHPEVAKLVAATPLPANLRPVIALDGFVTWRSEPPAQLPQWLGGSAAPRTRATAILQQARFGDSNVLVPTLGAGAEVRLMLDQLNRRQAAFVYEPDLTVLAAVLRTVDLSNGIGSHRCFFLHPDPEPELNRLMNDWPGLKPPTVLLLAPGVAAEIYSDLREICERTVSRTTAARKTRLQSLFTPSPSIAIGPARLAILAGYCDADERGAATEIHAASVVAGQTATLVATDTPLMGDPLAPLEQIVGDRCSAVLILDSHPAQWPSPPRVQRLHWRTKSETSADPTTVQLAASPLLLESLRESGVPAAKCGSFFWATPEFIMPHVDGTGPAQLAWSASDLSPEANGMSQATHQRLWKEIQTVARAELCAGRLAAAVNVLTQAEKAATIRLQDDTLRAALLDRIARRVVPTLAAELATASLQKAGRTVLGPGAEAATGAAALAPAAVVITTTLIDGWTRPLALWAGKGTPVLVFDPSGGLAARQLAGLLEPGRHYEIIRTLDQLPKGIELLCRDDAAYGRAAQRLFSHMQQHHTWRCRLEQLAKALATVNTPQ